MDKDTPKISVIMGIYNCEKTLSTAIESIIKQTYENWELIMCDDGSTDDTYKIAQSYQINNPDKIIVIKNEVNMRLAASLNCCLKRATGEYIARMDGDDESLPDRFEEEINFLKINPQYTCVGTNLIVFDEKGDRNVRVCAEKPNKEMMIHGVPFAHPTVMMKKSAYDDLGGYTVSKDTLRAEDVDLWFRFFSKGYKGYVIQKPLYRYRETQEDFKKRNFKAAVGTAKVYLRGFKLLKFSKIKYIYALKPIISACVPNKIMRAYHTAKDKRNS